MAVREQLQEREILRYRKRPRIVHAMLASSFLLMLLTGSDAIRDVILFPQLKPRSS